MPPLTVFWILGHVYHRRLVELFGNGAHLRCPVWWPLTTGGYEFYIFSHFNSFTFKWSHVDSCKTVQETTWDAMPFEAPTGTICLPAPASALSIPSSGPYETGFLSLPWTPQPWALFYAVSST